MEAILDLFRNGDNFVLVGHTAPDGDAIGSCFALALALSNMGKNVRVVLEPFAHKYANIPGRNFLCDGKALLATGEAAPASGECEHSGDVSTGESGVPPSEERNLLPASRERDRSENVSTVECGDATVVALDCADLERLAAARPLFEQAKTTVCIDHHETNSGFAQFNYIEATASSTSEMVYKVVSQLTEITPDIAAAVYAGMVSDTGGFRYNATSKSTMEIAARLMEMIPFTKIYNELMHIHRFAAGKAFGVAMANCARTPDKKIVYSFITHEELKSVGAKKTDLDGIVEYLMGTRNALMAIFVYEKARAAHGVKVSLRSQGPNAGRVALKLGGGGHILAAGASVKASVPEALERAISLAAREVNIFVSGGKPLSTVDTSSGRTHSLEAGNNLRSAAGASSGLSHSLEAGDDGKPLSAGGASSGRTHSLEAGFDSGGVICPVGVINIRKEKGYTSHDVVAILRKIAQTKRVGHTGTLDPDATGVLPVCIGRATKFAEHITAADKTYLAEIILGLTTDTGDISGKVLTQADASAITHEELTTAAESFKYSERGEYLQTPPMYSAVKVGGKKLYELAREGKTIDRKPRPVKIHELRVLPPHTETGYERTPTNEDASTETAVRRAQTDVCRAHIDVTCSKGTYIRSLCMDIGEKLGCGAVMGDLIRTRSGIFDIEDSYTLDEVRAAAENGQLGELVLPLAKLLPYPEAFVSPDGLIRALNGNSVPAELVASESELSHGDKCWLHAAADGELIGLFTRTQKKFIPDVMC